MKSSWMSYGGKGKGKNTGFIVAAESRPGNSFDETCWRSQFVDASPVWNPSLCRFSIPKFAMYEKSLLAGSSALFWFPNFALKFLSLALIPKCGLYFLSRGSRGNCQHSGNFKLFFSREINYSFITAFKDLNFIFELVLCCVIIKTECETWMVAYQLLALPSQALYSATSQNFLSWLPFMQRCNFLPSLKFRFR